MGAFQIADIIRVARPALERQVRLNGRQRALLIAIERCRTEVLGGVTESCPDCEFERQSCATCRNRHCPRCQVFEQEQWIERQRERTLEMQHFHLVFTLPSRLRRLVRFASKRLYAILLKVVGQTLAEFALENWNATLGGTLVLHTWNRKLEFHPHVHAIVTGGGLRRDTQRVFLCPDNFMFPHAALARVFRGKFTDALIQAYEEGAFAGFDDFDDPQAFALLRNRLHDNRWYVYAKPTFDRAEHVLQYLGRYTHRVGIAKSRILRVDDKTVTFRTRGSETETTSLVEFLRRFVLHVLPKGFHKIRHIGLNLSAKKRALVQELLGSKRVVRLNKDWRQRYQELNGRDVCTCPRCGGQLHSHPFPRSPAPRAPPIAAGLPRLAV